MLARLHTRLSVFFSTSASICKRSGLVILLLPKMHQEIKKPHFVFGSPTPLKVVQVIIRVRPNCNGCNYGMIVIISQNDCVLTSHWRRPNYGGSPHTSVLATTPSSHLSVLMIASLKLSLPPSLHILSTPIVFLARHTFFFFSANYFLSSLSRLTVHPPSSSLRRSSPSSPSNEEKNRLK